VSVCKEALFQDVLYTSVERHISTIFSPNTCRTLHPGNMKDYQKRVVGMSFRDELANTFTRGI